MKKILLVLSILIAFTGCGNDPHKINYRVTNVNTGKVYECNYMGTSSGSIWMVLTDGTWIESFSGEYKIERFNQ